MKSAIHQKIGTVYPPIALLWSDEAPGEAMQFKPGKWGCVMWLAANAAKGRVSVCDRETFGCWGGGVGLGFGARYKDFPGGEECFCRFLSTGNDDWEKGRQVADQAKPYMTKESHENFLHGERYIKSPELVQRFIDALPIVDIPSKYVVFKPLEVIDSNLETPQVVIFFADPDQLSALVVLANYGRGDNENVIIPYAAGCQTIGIYPYREDRSDMPRAVVGLTDLSARLNIRKQLGDNLMTFSMPYSLFREMEENVPGSFLEAHTWTTLRKERET